MLFSAQMVRALLNGSKTQTRRVAKHPLAMAAKRILSYHGQTEFDCIFEDESGGIIHCPYGKPNDRLWVREAWRVIDVADCLAPREITSAYRIWYEADAPHQPGFGKYRPPMFMPRWASRISLEITGVRVERLQDITVSDAMAEGYDGSIKSPVDPSIEWYSGLWESINGPGSWSANPWVWVIDFKKIQGDL
jgi:hypothetical protein